MRDNVARSIAWNVVERSSARVWARAAGARPQVCWGVSVGGRGVVLRVLTLDHALWVWLRRAGRDAPLVQWPTGPSWFILRERETISNLEKFREKGGTRLVNHFCGGELTY